MEEKELTIKEKALCTEKMRISHIIDLRNKLEIEYENERKKWLKKEKEYMDRLTQMNKSIESGYLYVEETEKILKK